MFITLVKEKVYKNGDIKFTFDVDDEFKSLVLKKYNKKTYTDKLGTLFILDVLRNDLISEIDKLFDKAKKLNNVVC